MNVEAEATSTWPSGPIAVTGATGHVGRALLRRLRDLPNEARPLGRGDDLGRGFADAAAVVHLAGTLQPLHGETYEAANRETVRATVAALAETTVKRVVFLSYVGADPASSNAYLRAKGEAEDLLRRCGRATVILRSTFIYGPPDDPGPTASAFMARGKRVKILGSGEQRVAPIFVGDVVEVVVRAALASDGPTGPFDLGGPNVVSVDEFVDGLNAAVVEKRHLSARLSRALAHVVPGLTPELVDVMLADSLAQGRRADAAFAVPLHSLENVFREGVGGAV